MMICLFKICNKKLFLYKIILYLCNQIGIIMINKLKKVMREERISSDQLAKRIDVTVATVNNWKKATRISSDTIEIICKELGKEVKDVFVFKT